MNAQKAKNLPVLLLIPAIVLFYIFSGGSVGIALDFGEEVLKISAETYDWSIAYDQIESLELAVPDNTASLIDGVQKRTLHCGVFEGKPWGHYTQCIDPRIEKCIVIHMLDGTVFTVNYENADTTNQLYKMFTDLLHGS